MQMPARAPTVMVPEEVSESAEELEAAKASPEDVPVADGEADGCTGARLAVRSADREGVADGVCAVAEDVGVATDWERVAVRVRVEICDGDLDCDTDTLPYWEEVEVGSVLADAVTLGLAVTDAVMDVVCSAEGVTVPEADPLWLPLPLPLFVGV